MQDGSEPGKSYNIERFCFSIGTRVVANTAKNGRFIYTADVDSLKAENCVLRASASGYESTVVPISHLNWWSDPNLPDIILRVRDASLGAENTINNSNIYFFSSSVPANARQPWNNALRAMEKSNWEVAERQLRIVVQYAPKMAEAWNYLGAVTERLNKHEDAARAFETASQTDPKLTAARLGLVRAYLDLKKWPEAEAAAGALIQEKADAQNPEIHTQLAIARYSVGNLEGAESSVQEAIRRDTKRLTPRSELVFATILEARGDFDGARAHLQRYLEIDPRAADAADIRERINNVGKTPATGGASAPALEAIRPVVDAAGEAWVPGGMKALAKMAAMQVEPSYQTFFEEYCRAIGREVSVGTGTGIPRFGQGLRVFLATVTELIPLGEKRGETTVLRISTAEGERRQQAKRVLGLLGWTLEVRDGKVRVEPGYRAEDALLQAVTSALGIDQIAMQESLQSGGEFQFEVVSENARLVGGNMWSEILIKDAVPPGGLAAVFATDMRIAKTCAGLNSMNASAAATVMSAVGLRNLAAKDAEVLYRYSEAFTIAGGRADVPGGTAADPFWQKLTGANPRNPGDFFRAVVDKDFGRLAAFYFTLAHADAAHQQYFTRSADQAERYYQWFHDSPEIHGGIVTHTPGFHTEFLQSVPLDGSGNILFPGGRSAWFQGTEVPLNNPILEALVPVARLEQQRGSPLDEQLAGLLARNYAQWKTLFPYFESLPTMGRDDYAALATFAESLGRRSDGDRNAVLGEWYALVDLIVRGAKAGSLNAADAARAFRQVSLGLAGDSHTAQAAALLRQVAGSGDLEDGVATNLLRLDAERRTRFDRVLELLHAPRIGEAKPAEMGAALSAFVYAAALDPGLLLLNEDPALLGRHRYANGSGPLFARAELIGSQDAKGTHFSGGFLGFEDAAQRLMGGAKAAPRAPVVARVAAAKDAPGTGSTGDDEQAPDFRSDSNMVEVYTTVTDGRGRYVDDLTLAQFTLVDRKAPQTIVAFEPQTSDLSVALLLDTTGSMADTISSLKRAAIKLIDSLRPDDSVAVYSFSNQVTELAAFTTDRGIAKRAVMNTRPMGDTALYDAIARAGHEMTGRSGKKVVIVFTDGRDTTSMLTVEAAIERAKVAGIPVYTIAEGDAMDNVQLTRQLAAISNATGGVPFQVRDPDDMAAVFEKVSEDLAHGYLLFFQAPPGDDHAWREIRVVVEGKKDLKIRAREGYYP